MDLRAANASFRRTLRAGNKSKRTIQAYTDAGRFLADFLAANGFKRCCCASRSRLLGLREATVVAAHERSKSPWLRWVPRSSSRAACWVSWSGRARSLLPTRAW